jgi:hypothetical protein
MDFDLTDEQRIRKASIGRSLTGINPLLAA